MTKRTRPWRVKKESVTWSKKRKRLLLPLFPVGWQSSRCGHGTSHNILFLAMRAVKSWWCMPTSMVKPLSSFSVGRVKIKRVASGLKSFSLCHPRRTEVHKNRCFLVESSGSSFLFNFENFEFLFSGWSDYLHFIPGRFTQERLAERRFVGDKTFGWVYFLSTDDGVFTVLFTG